MLVKYAKSTWVECQLQVRYLQLSEKLTLLNMCFSHILLLQTNQLASYDGNNGSVIKRPTDSTTSTTSGQTSTTSGQTSTTSGKTSTTSEKNKYYEWKNEYYEWEKSITSDQASNTKT